MKNKLGDHGLVNVFIEQGLRNHFLRAGNKCLLFTVTFFINLTLFLSVARVVNIGNNSEGNTWNILGEASGVHFQNILN